MWSFVRWRIARWASRSLARLRSSWAAERVETERVPALDARFLPEVAEPGWDSASEVG